MQVRDELDKFIDEPRQAALMMLALSDKVDAPGCNMFDQAHIVKDRATAKNMKIAVLVAVGRGVHLLSNAGIAGNGR